MRTISFLKGLGLGLAAMYFLDPQQGRRRRARLRDQCESALRDLTDDLSAYGRDLRNRTRGAIAERRATMRTEGFVPDDLIEERVRSAIGRHTSHSSSIQVGVRGGCVILRGPILAREVDGVISAAKGTRGVQDVVNEMDVHQEPGNVSGLQGGRSDRARPQPQNEG